MGLMEKNIDNLQLPELLSKLQVDSKKYGFFFFLILLHLIGGSVANAAIIVSSCYSFFYFSFKKELDLYVVFLLLFTNICMGQNSEAENVSNINIGVYNNFLNVLIIGPLALSTKFAFALAVPVRVLMNITKAKSYFSLLLWFFIIFTSLVGLFLSFSSGVENKAGLTVGFRIALTMGVVLLPAMVCDRKEFLKQLDKILITSLIALALGLMNAHWLFITYGFLPYLWFRYKSIFAKVLVFMCFGRLLIGVEASITIVGTLLVSIAFGLLIRLKILGNKSLRYFGLLLVLLPILITIYVLSLPVDKIGYSLESLWGYIEFKLIGDRKPIWDASYLQIISQNFFIAPAGSSLEVYFDYIMQWRDWPEGSHNIFLEIGRQISAFAMITFTCLIVNTLFKAFRNLSNEVDSRIILCFAAVYLAFGLSGQHIVYDGVGFMFWLLVSQLTIINNENNEDITSIVS
jgi:hypothetical protein